MKQCKRCNQIKNEDEFYQNGIGGMRPKCKQCEQEAANKRFKNKKCFICGAEFKPFSTVNKYCSGKCKAQADLNKRSKKPNAKKCKVCNNEFNPYTSLDKYCSPNCRYENEKSRIRKASKRWSKEKANKRIGKNNPAYRNGMYLRTAKKTSNGLRGFQRNGNEILAGMKEDKGYVYCQMCTVSGSLRFEKHHIIYRSEMPSHPKLHCKKNILILCINCHNEYHKTKGLRNNIVKERRLDLIFGKSVLNK